MPRCELCGRENNSSATVCVGCGSELQQSRGGRKTSNIWLRILVWGPLSLLLLLLAPFLLAFAEYSLFETYYVEDAFRWLGVHETLRRVLDWLLL
jgi:hypothetical protein